jgi:hypothetical protein
VDQADQEQIAQLRALAEQMLERRHMAASSMVKRWAERILEILDGK